jgi:16S rRNA (cytidine1402-2'-O)-methyltransferase
MLPVKTEARRAALGKLSHERHTWVVLDAPYRLAAVLEDMRTAVGANRQVVVACELTRPTEKVVRGAAGQVVEHFRIHPFKGEFVIVVAGKGNT